MKFILKIATALCLPAFILSGCRKEEKYPAEPVITFSGVTVYKTIDTLLGNEIVQMNIRILFTDGDGDIGLTDADTVPPFDPGSPYYYNLVTTCYEKKNGSYSEVPEPASFRNYRIPVLPVPANKHGIKGEIQVKKDLYSVTSNPIKYDIYIYDRSLHKSNVISTTDITVQ